MGITTNDVSLAVFDTAPVHSCLTVAPLPWPIGSNAGVRVTQSSWGLHVLAWGNSFLWVVDVHAHVIVTTADFRVPAVIAGRSGNFAKKLVLWLQFKCKHLARMRARRNATFRRFHNETKTT